MKKNLAIIIQKLNGGGAERTASNLSLILSEKYNVHLIVFDGSDIKYPYAGKMHNLNMKPSKSKLGKIINSWKRILMIKRIKKDEKINVSISLLDNANYANVCSRSGDKIITSVRNQMSKRKKVGLYSVLEMKKIVKHSDLIVSLSNGVKSDLAKNFGVPTNKIRTIYNPVDGVMLLEHAKLHENDIGEITKESICTMGRLNVQKGQWHLIRAFGLVVKKIPDAKLYIFGEGELYDNLLKLTKDLNLINNVMFMGYVESPHSYIKKCRAFVFPSLYEGLGNVLLESMSCGTPCIATDCFSGPREIISPNTEVKECLDNVEYLDYGILTSVCGHGLSNFNATDDLTSAEIQIAEAVIRIITDDELHSHYSKKGLERSLHFSPQQIKEEWISVIEK